MPVDPCYEIVRRVLAEHLDVDASQVHLEQHLETDLGMTALGLVLVALDLEEVECVSLPFDELKRIKTVGQLCELVRGAPLLSSARMVPAFS